MGRDLRVNQAVNKSEIASDEEINSIDFYEPEKNNENARIQQRIASTKIAMYFLKLENSLQYIEIENPYTNKKCNLLVDSGA